VEDALATGRVLLAAPGSDPREKASDHDTGGEGDSDGFEGILFDGPASVIEGVFGSVTALLGGLQGRANAILHSIRDDGLDLGDFAEKFFDGGDFRWHRLPLFGVYRGWLRDEQQRLRGHDWNCF
jgi:hypothetical protein